jgi:hypothetical protein
VKGFGTIGGPQQLNRDAVAQAVDDGYRLGVKLRRRPASSQLDLGV